MDTSARRSYVRKLSIVALPHRPLLHMGRSPHSGANPRRSMAGSPAGDGGAISGSAVPGVDHGSQATGLVRRPTGRSGRPAPSLAPTRQALLTEAQRSRRRCRGRSRGVRPLAGRGARHQPAVLGDGVKATSSKASHTRGRSADAAGGSRQTARPRYRLAVRRSSTEAAGSCRGRRRCHGSRQRTPGAGRRSGPRSDQPQARPAATTTPTRRRTRSAVPTVSLEMPRRRRCPGSRRPRLSLRRYRARLARSEQHQQRVRAEPVSEAETPGSRGSRPQAATLSRHDRPRAARPGRPGAAAPP